MGIYRLNKCGPQLPEPGDYWVAPSATVVGDVRIGSGVGIWFGAVLRGDNEPITVGERTNIQEHAIVHADPGYPAVIGVALTIGHRAIIHGCAIGDGSLIGMGAIVLNGARIGRGCLIGAGTLVTEGKDIPDGSLVVGSPGKVFRTLDEAAQHGLLRSAEHYVTNWQRFANGMTEI